MKKKLLGLKVYSRDWYWKYNLSYDEAIDKLKSMNVNFIISKDTSMPMVDTAVKSEIPKNLSIKWQNMMIIYFGIN